MSRKKKEIVEDTTDETIEATDGGEVIAASNRTDKIAAIVNALAVMPKDRLDAVMEAIGTKAENVEENEDSEKESAEKALKESIEKDLVEAFGDENMPEAMRTRISTLFESALNTRLNLEVEQLSEAFDESVEAEVEARIAELTEVVNRYVTATATEWISENEVAIQNSLRNELAESFLEYMREGFEAFNFDIPDDKVDLVSELESRLAEAEDALNEMYEENIELKAVLNESLKDEIMSDMTEGLSMAQASKLRQLTEGIEADSPDMFAEKVGIVREKYFPGSKPSTKLLAEDVDEDLTEEIEDKTPTPSMSKYLTALDTISNSVKK